MFSDSGGQSEHTEWEGLGTVVPCEFRIATKAAMSILLGAWRPPFA